MKGVSFKVNGKGHTNTIKIFNTTTTNNNNNNDNKEDDE